MTDTPQSSPADTQANQLWIKLEEARNSKRLGFLISLDKDIDYKRLLCSKARLQEIMDMLGIDQKELKLKAKKCQVVAHYRKYAAPIVDRFVRCTRLNSTSANTLPAGPSTSTAQCFDGDIVMTSASNTSPACTNSTPPASNSTPTSSTDDIKTPCPVLKSTSKVEELREGLKKSVHQLVSRGFNKGALVKLQSHISNKKPKGVEIPLTPGNIRRPFIVSIEEMSKKDRDSIRKALHMWCPQLWIPINVATSRPMLLALYNLFCLDNEEPDLCQGVHYDIFPLQELNFDGMISF